MGEAEAACAQAREVFAAALVDDLNTPEALAAVHNLVTRANALLGRPDSDPRRRRAGPAELESMDSVFGVFFPAARTALTAEEQAPASTRGRTRASGATSPPPTPRGVSSRRWASCSRTRPRARAGSGRGEPARSAFAACPAVRASRARRLAADHLVREGLVVLARNYRCRGGELDLVARDADGTDRLRRGQGAPRRTHGEGFEAVTVGKRRRLLRAARHYASRHGALRGASSLRRGLG